MKKAVSVILTVVFIMLTLAFTDNVFALTQDSSIAKTQFDDTDTYYEFDAQSRTLTISGIGNTPNFDTNGVGAPWYEWRDSSIDTVIVEEGVTNLGDYFLFGVKASRIELPHSINRLGNYSLADTENITSWDLPFGLKSIGGYALAYNNQLENVTIPDTVTTINSRAFQGCKSIEEIVIPYSVRTIGIYTFYQCTSLKKVEFQSMTATVSIGSYCFMGCESLKSIMFPMNATISQYCFGYESKNKKYSDVMMTVYNNSSALNFAVSNGISYTVADIIPMQCGVTYKSTYSEDNIDNELCFEFTALENEVYNFYSFGACDTRAVIKDSNNNIIAENDDVSNSDRNFLISVSLSKDTTYYLCVNSVMSFGECNVIVYPDVIYSIDVFGSLSMNASQGDYSGDIPTFEISDDVLSDYILTVNFNDGYVDWIYYYNGMFDNKEICYNNQQSDSPFTCGDNDAEITIGNIAGVFNVNIIHSYGQTVIPYTADDDGYTLNTCVLCGDSYKDNYVMTPAITVSGVAYIKENKTGKCSNHIPYTHFVIRVDGREYPVSSDGSWSFNTLSSCTATLDNEYGNDEYISVDFDEGSRYYGAVALQGYDFNSDGYVNGKDYALYVKNMGSPYGLNYLEYFAKNMS